tara:strand:- start:178 stop:744 length:567 start_codon:yes stop_codon:yes gene_type:complete
MDPTQALKDFAHEKVARIEKYIHTPMDANVVLSTERYMHKADITIKAHGFMMRGQEKSEDMYSSIDGAVDKIERQVRKYRKKITSHKPREGQRMKVRLNYMEPHEDNLIDNEAEEQALSEINATPPPAIAKTQELDAHPLSINEAIIQMDLMHNDFLVFVNAETNEVNVLYRREDEGLGLIETHARPS